MVDACLFPHECCLLVLRFDHLFPKMSTSCLVGGRASITSMNRPFYEERFIARTSRCIMSHHRWGSTACRHSRLVNHYVPLFGSRPDCRRLKTLLCFPQAPCQGTLPLPTSLSSDLSANRIVLGRFWTRFEKDEGGRGASFYLGNTQRYLSRVAQSFTTGLPIQRALSKRICPTSTTTVLHGDRMEPETSSRPGYMMGRVRIQIPRPPHVSPRTV